MTELGMRIVVNPTSGPVWSSNPAEKLRSELTDAEVIELEGEDDIASLLGVPPVPRAVGVSGGDGTVGATASVALDLGVPLLVVPGGTLNHFAGDLAIASVDDAIDAVRQGTTTHVDVAHIDEHLFLNNASIGMYPEVVDHRERWEHRVGKWPALVIALAVVLRRGAPVHVELDGRPRRLWFAFFGNCRYDQAGLVAPSGRSSLADGLLDVRLVHADRKWARLRLITCALLRRLDRCSVYEATAVARLTVTSADGALRLAADGETFDGSEAFEIRKRPSALEVFSRQ